MSCAIVSIQQLVQDFFEKHLTIERNASRNTVMAYRDALRLFLSYAAHRFECSVDQLEHQILDVDVVRSFLAWLDKERKCSAHTRNHRLAAIKAFVRYVAFAAPEHLERCRRIRELPRARFERPEVEYLEPEEVRELIKATQQRRDTALLLLMYNTGARVQEIVDLDVCDLRLDLVPVVTLEGKGRKQRTSPLLDRTVDALRQWLAERGDAEGPLFPNAQGRRLSRSGVAYILRKLAQRAGLVLRHAARVTPHVIRHTTAMHLLRSEVDITTIAAWLGHSQLTTTHGYVEVDLRMKRKALAATAALPELTQGKYPDGELLTWLAGLGRSRRYVESPPPIPTASLRRNRLLHITGRCT